MWKLIELASFQTFFLALGQMLLKLVLLKHGKLEWNWAYLKPILFDWRFPTCGISFSIATILWLYILRRFPFSQAYPLTSLSFVFGMIMSCLVFGETIPFFRWIGLILVVGGCFLIMK